MERLVIGTVTEENFYIELEEKTVIATFTAICRGIHSFSANHDIFDEDIQFDGIKDIDVEFYTEMGEIANLTQDEIKQAEKIISDYVELEANIDWDYQNEEPLIEDEEYEECF